MTCPTTTPLFFLTDQTFSGPADRFAHNIQALTLLAALTRDQREATDEEKRILAHYTAFGESALISKLVNHPDRAISELLSEQDLAGLRRAALTAFYTPLPIVAAIWEALAQLGFRNLPSFRMLEPAAGVGNIISAMPPDLRERAQITAVELEPLSARILSLIHPDLTLHAGRGFQDVNLPQNSFDLIVSNVPFGDFGVADVTMPERFLTARIHDYFFAKAIGLLRPGGIVCFLTSYGTLDKRDDRMRQWLAERAELLAAYRLPSGIFAENAGSQAGIDLLILRKYHIDETPQAAQWLALAEADLPPWTGGRLQLTTGARYGDAPDTLKIGSYFVTNPEQVIGTSYAVRDSNRLFYAVLPPGDADLAGALRRRLAVTLPLDIVTEAAEPLLITPSSSGRDLLSDADELDPTVVSAAQLARATSLADVYRAAKALIREELQSSDDAVLDAARAELNRVYDAFVASYGIISTPTNRRLFKHLPELAFLIALEERPHRQDDTWVADKAPIFHRRTLRPLPRLDDGSLSVQDALIRSLDTTGAVDLPLICRLSGHNKDTVLNELHGVLFRVPNLAVEEYQTADAYLSGNVRAKLREARALAEINPSFLHHVAALEAVQPPLLGKDEIMVRLGAAWVPSQIVAAFLSYLLPAFRGSVRFQEFDASWKIIPNDAARRSVENTSRWGTPRMTALEIVQALLGNTPVIVRDTIELPDGGMTTVVNDKETAAAQEKAIAIRVAFAEWIWADPTREQQLITLYNERFNALRPRQYDGSHLSLPGLNTTVLRGGDLSEWQKAAVWQALQNPATLLAHAVGAGKTFTMVAIAREARRMGLAHKPLLVVPNHLVGQTANEALRLFPGLKVLALGSEDFARERRGVVLSRIATGDWDLIIVPFTSFQFLPIDAEVLECFHERERARLRAALESAHDDARQPGADKRSSKRAIKKIEKALERLEVRIKNAIGRIKRDSERTITWHELGIDLLMVDEAHGFKNLYVPSRLQVAGAPQTDSLRALDMRIKTWDLLRRGKKVLFATATPIMNTLGEAYVMQLYLQEQELAALGIDMFDAWVSVFAEVRDMFEMKPDGSGFQVKSRLNTFINLPELAELWRVVMNVRTAEQLSLPRPSLVGGKPIVVSLPASNALKRLIGQFVRRVDAIKNGQVDPRIDNMLKLTSEARLAALDTRLLVGGPEAPRCKINALVERVAWLYHTYDAARATQLIFCDLATPKGKAEPMPETAEAEADPNVPPAEEATAAEQSLQNDVYAEIRRKLARQGIPAAEVAFIHDYPTKAKRDELFAAMNAGTMRVLIGSTNKMGTGMNVQQRLIALHHLDAPWRPGDVEQRDGRILRQGNLWPAVYIFHYVTEQSFDGYLWQLLENKARFISQVITGEVTARSADDIGDTVLTAAEIKAIASGNPRILERFKLETELAKLERVRRAWLDTRTNLDWKRRTAHDRIAGRVQRIAELEAALPIYHAHADADFQIALEERVGDDQHVIYTKRADAGKALRLLLHQYTMAARFQKQTIVRTIGAYRGFTLRVHAPHYELGSTKLIIDATTDAGHVEVVDREFDRDITEQGVFASIDAGLRGIAEELAQKQARNRADEAEIAAYEAELARTSVWEHEQRWQRLCAELAEITAALAAVDTSSEGETPSSETPAPTEASDTTDTVSAEAIAAAEQAVADHAGDDAYQILTTPIEAMIPPAFESLALLRTFIDGSRVEPAEAHDTLETAAEAEADVLLETAESEAEVEEDTAPLVLDLPCPTTPAHPRLVFGDPAALVRLRPRRSAPLPLSAVPPTQPDQLDLFATLEMPTLSPREREMEPALAGAEQLSLL